MANALLSPKVYANSMLALLTNRLVMGKLVNTEFKNEFKSVGSTIYVKRPPLFTLRTGAVANVQNVVVGEQPVVLDTQVGVDIKFTSLEDTVTVDDLLKSTTMKSAASTLAQGVDAAIMAKTLEFPNWVGTPGLDVDSATDFFKAPERLDDMAVPGDDRVGILATRDWWGTAGSFVGLYAQKEVADMALKQAAIPMLGDVQPYKSQNVITMVTGTRNPTAGTVNGANQYSSYLNVRTNYQQNINLSGYAAGATFSKGEVFTMAGVFAVNPKSGATYGYLAQFTVLAAATADGSGNVTLTIANPIIVGSNTGDAAYATVSAAPANGAAVTFLGTASTGYRQNSVFHKSAIALTYAKLSTPFSGETAYATDKESGVTIRYWRSSDIVNDEHFHRWDMLLGVTNADRRLGTRLSGT